VDVRGTFPGEKKKTWEDVLGEKLPDKLVQARDAKHKVHFLIERETAAAAAKAVGRTLPKEFVNGHGSNGQQNWQAQQAEREKKQKAQTERRKLLAPIALDLFNQVMAKTAAEPTANWWRWQARCAVEQHAEFWSELLGHKSVKAFEEWIEKAKPDDLRGLLVAANAIGSHRYHEPFVTYEDGIAESLIDACEFYGIDAKKLIAQKEADAKAAAKAEKAKPAKDGPRSPNPPPSKPVAEAGRSVNLSAPFYNRHERILDRPQ
jgi:hypothetical protein